MRKKFIPMFVCGVAAVSFSALGFAAGGSYGSSAGASSDRNPESTQEGRSVDTGGASPDSSKAQGSTPVTSPAPGASSSSAGASTAERDLDRDKDRERTGEASTGTGTTSTTPGGQTAVPGGPGSGMSGSGDS